MGLYPETQKDFMKFLFIMFMLLSQAVFAEAPCDIRLGTTVGVRAIEFTSGNVIHSKMPLREMSVAGLREEMVNLQDMGICEPKLQRKRCILKFEKSTKGNQLTMFRGSERWLSWSLAGKNSAQKFVRILQQAGFCL
jgi:hypothetical protein